jgi:FkbH-like protein
MRTFQQLKRLLKQPDPDYPRVRLALLGDSATQFLATAIQGEALARGICLELFEGEYNQVERQVLDPTSDLHRFGADYLVVFQSSHKLLEKYSLMEAEQRTALCDERLEFVRTLCGSFPGKIIYYNYPEIGDGVFGSYQNRVEVSFIYQVRKLNLGLMTLSQECPNLFICDLSELQAKLGRDFCFDSSVYVSTEMLLSLDALPYVASRTLDIVCAIRGSFKKCLILDLDNTLWGGVVGDDGWENIQIGHGLGIGKAFSEFQQWVRKLKDRGIIICVCSKNDDDKAREPFEKNPEMVLRLDDIAVFIANWENKVDNIRTIRQILNIGFDSMVFLDDNPFERNIVREGIPEICVPELPEDPGDYLEYLYGLNLFETASYSSADKDRTKQYQVEARRTSSALSFSNEADFLRSLEMVSEVRGFNAFNIPRVAQLSQRSNQFNLRTVRYTEDEVRRLGEDPSYACFSFTLSDKFGDNGLICVVILEKRDAGTLFIDTWLMSCRVLKRGMEAFTLNTLVEYAREHGFRHLVGEYLPTAKNAMVAEHYPRLGFTPDPEAPERLFTLDVDTFTPLDCFIVSK